VADNEVPFKIKADTEEAQKSIESFGSSAISVVGKLEVAFAALGAVVAGFTFKAAIDAAAESDQAVQQLNISLASTGEFSKEASQGLQEYAAAIQETTGISDEAVLSAYSLAKTFGISNEEAKKLTDAAINLSAATGRDLDTAIQQLGGTFSGTVGKLSKLSPELKNLTEQQLKAGAAVDIVARKFDGFAATLSNTFEGATKKASNAFGEVLEAIGKSVTQNVAVIEVFNTLSATLLSIADIFNQNKESIAGFIKDGLIIASKAVAVFAAVLSGLIDIFKPFITYIELLVIGLTELGKIIIYAVIQPFNYLYKAILLVSDGLIQLVRLAVNTANSIPILGKSVAAVGIDLEKLDSSLASLGKTLKDKAVGNTKTFGDSLVEFVGGAADTVEEKFVGLGEGIRSVSNGFQKGTDIIGVNALKLVDKLDKIQNPIKEASEGIKNFGSKGNLEDLTSQIDKVKGSFDKLKTSLESIQREREKENLSTKELIELETKRALILAENAKRELIITGKNTAENRQSIQEYTDAVIQAEQDLKAQLGGRFITLNPNFKNDLISTWETGAKSANAVLEKLGLHSLDKAAKSAVEIIENIDLQGGFVTGLVNAITTALKSTDEKSRFQGIGGIITGALTTYLGPLGQVLGNFITQLSLMGKDQTREFISEFVKSAPAFVKAIAENLPEIIKGLFDVIKDPKFWMEAGKAWFLTIRTLYINLYGELYKAIAGILYDSFKGIIDYLDQLFGTGLTEFAQGFVESLQQFVTNVGMAIRDAFSSSLAGLRDSIRDGIASIGEYLSSVFGDAGQRIADAIFEPVNKLIDFFTNFDFGKLFDFGGGGGGGFLGQVGSAVSNVGQSLGFAKGGIVPKYAANGMFVPKGTDTVPAMLTAGELVVPRDTTSELQRFLANQNSGGTNNETTAMLMSILQTVQKPIEVSSSVEVNQQAFANIILQLNRQNMRLTA
jgi:hypothetical protein